jgi:superfamily I DNA/RNA helicase
MSLKPTKEQEKIFKFIKKRPENILIEAYAGCGKTTTIVEAVKLLPKDKNIMFMAFNKHIQEELKTCLPDHVRCYTSHGLGMSAIKRKYGDKIQFDEFKVDKVIQKKAKKWNLDSDFNSHEEKYRYLKDMKKMVNLCRLSLTTDKKYIPYIADRYEVPINKEKDIKRLLKVLDTITQDRLTFDYADMIYLPAVDKSLWLFPQDYVIIDECLPHKIYISTEIGKKQIGTLYNLKNNNKKLPKVVTYNEKLSTFEMKNILDVWCTGEKDVHYVILSGKRKLKSTVNHRFLTLDGWKRLDELKIGDAVLSNYSEQPYHGVLNSVQKDIFIGSILGDGSHHRLSNNISRIKIIHGNNQWKYIKWKASFFDCDLKTVEKNGYSKRIAHTLSTKGYYFHNKYDSKKKIIDDITLRSLAISWMDNGSISRLHNTSRLYSTSYSEELTEYLGNVLKDKWSINSQVKCAPSSSTNKLNYWLLFDKENTTKISKLISPYVYKSMEYKLCPEHRSNIDYSNWNSDLKSFGCMVVTKTHKFAKKEKVYDMTVEDNHNFIITSQTMNNSNAENFGLIAHNCQDINRAQQRLIEKMLRRDKHTKKYKGRLIAIGDGFQSIYAFTGITDRTFQWFKEFQNTKILPLSYSFRCSKKVTEHAQKIVPNIKALPEAPEGSVRDGDVLNEAKNGDFILCRTTAPLIRLFFEFLSQQKKAVIKGSDIGLKLIDLINDFKTIPKLIEYWESEIEEFKKKLYNDGILNPQEHSGFVALEDKVNTLLFLSRVSDTIEGLKHNIKTIFTDKLTGIVLSTIHKAKGLEANRVFIIRPDLIPLPNSKKWQYKQEKNLEYVAITRAKVELIYDHKWTDEE